MVNHSVGAGVLGGSSFSVYALRRFGSGSSPGGCCEVFSVPEAALLPQAASCSTMAAVNNAAVSFVFFIIFPPSERYQYVIIG